MSISKAEKWARIHSESMEEFNRVQRVFRDERLQCLQDRRFYSIAGAQWEGPLGTQFDNKPRFEFNRTHLSVIRVFNEYRANRITVDFQSKDGTPDDKMADTCDGLYRADEQISTANEAYDNAFEEGVGGGMGAWRLRPDYEDEADPENDRQRINFEPIFDADSTVFFDVDARRYDKKDAKRCWVLTPYSWDAYRDKWGDDPASWPKIVHQHEFDWAVPQIVWVAEYYVVEEVSELVHYYRSQLIDDEPDMKVTQAELDADENKDDQLQAMGFRKVRERRVKTRKVHKYLLSGACILEDCGFIAGDQIPIVPFYGKRWVVDGVERCMGHVRLAKDAQRLQNALMSWLAEMAGRFDIEKPMFTPEQIAGHAQMWADDNIKKYPYLLINSTTDQAGNIVPPTPIAYTKAPSIPPAMAALTEIATQALQDMLGNQEAGEEIQPNMSGKAVELIQQRLDMQVYIYMSNFAKSHKRAGEIWLSMMRDIAVEQSRKMKSIGSDGKTSSVTINHPMRDEESGEIATENDFSKASFDVVADVGPSSSSKRAATVRAVTGMIQLTQDPDTQQVLTAFAMMNMEGEGIDDIRDYFRKQLVQRGAIKPTKEEAAEMEQAQANQQPDPQSQYLLAAAQKERAGAAVDQAKSVDLLAAANLKHAQAQHLGAETHAVHADIAHTAAQIAHTHAQTKGEHLSHAIDASDAMLRAKAPAKTE